MKKNTAAKQPRPSQGSSDPPPASESCSAAGIDWTPGVTAFRKHNLGPTTIRPAMADDMVTLTQLDLENPGHALGANRIALAIAHGEAHSLVAAKVGVIGFCVLTDGDDALDIAAVSVQHLYFRLGLGRLLVAYAAAQAQAKQLPLRVTVRESALGLQLFFRATGFMAKRVCRKYFRCGDGHEEGYLFLRDCSEAAEACRKAD